MNAFRQRLHRFFFPPAGVRRWERILPYAVMGMLSLLVFISGAYVWDYTNSPDFCGTTCHTMPPEYTAYLSSPHARVDCVDCHIGKGFITTKITRKAGDAKHILFLAFRKYEFPIEARDMRPARESCELCHFPEKFSDDSLREIKHYGNDKENTPVSVYLVMKTGGGSKRLGLGRGIHWHIENPVYYLPLDKQEQQIPYVRVVNEDGSYTEYMDVEADIDPAQIDESALKPIDCITCHNRITHLIYPPEDVVDRLISRGQISAAIPEIRKKSVEMFYRPFKTIAMALNAIAGLDGYYRDYYPEFYAENRESIQQAIQALQEAYSQSVFPEQKADWNAHPNNIGHEFSPGCFRCHDGKHLNADQEAIRLECNLCHSIPVVARSGDFVSRIEISRGPEPESHLSPNWISLHHDAFDPTCASCHTTEDPGGVSDTSFCSNSACHGNVWEYAGFDAPALREIIQAQLPAIAPTAEVPTGGPLTYADTIGPIFVARCGHCHGDTALQGLKLTAYDTALAGGASGPAIIPGDPENSLLIQKQSGDQPHFGQLSAEELSLVRAWIETGAP